MHGTKCLFPINCNGYNCAWSHTNIGIGIDLIGNWSMGKHYDF